MGVGTKNTLQYISVNQIHLSLGQLLSSALLAFHALFDCDYTSAFSRRGKFHPFKCLENNQEAECAFSNLAEDQPSIEEKSGIKKFICALYGNENCIPLMM